jgi:hypothetical protein
MKKPWLSVAAVALLCAHAPASAQLLGALVGGGTEKSATKEGFVFRKEGPVRIILFRPDVHVGEQTAGGLDQPNADWTAEAKGFLTAALTKAQSTQNNSVTMMPEMAGADAIVMADYRSLFKAVADAAFTHKLFPGNRLPTKKDAFDWTLGEGAAKLGEMGGGDYGLFLYTYDSYGSAGRKAVQAVGAIFGVAAPSGVHIGYAGLVDLQTGDLVWINADIQMGGDVRTAEGADKRVQQLLEDFPRRGDQPIVTVGG